MRIAVVTESFLPTANGVSNSVRHLLDHLAATGHDALVVAPGPGPVRYRRFPVVRVRSIALPGYASFPLGLPTRRLADLLERFDPDVVHLASPVLLGAHGVFAARRLGVPSVAVYQTDVASFATAYGWPLAAPALRAWTRAVHGAATRTLAPSGHAQRQLQALGVPEVYPWGRARRGHRTVLPRSAGRCAAPAAGPRRGGAGRVRRAAGPGEAGGAAGRAGGTAGCPHGRHRRRAATSGVAARPASATRAYAEAMSAAGHPVWRLPGLDPSGGAPARPGGHAWWLASRGLPWLAARGRQLVPHLVRLALAGDRAGADPRAVSAPGAGLDCG